MVSCDIIHPGALNASDRRAWLGLEAGNGFRSPLLHPDFAALVGAVREDARLALIRDGAELTGAFAYHQRPGGLGRPIGAPFADIQGFSAAPGAAIDGANWLAASGLRAMPFDAFCSHDAVFSELAEAPSVHAIRLEGDAEAFLESRRALFAKRFKNHRRLARQMEREHGGIELLVPDRALSHFETLLGWKRRQFARTGLHDVLAPRWAGEMMQRLFDTPEDAELRGLMATLTVGGRFAAGLFGVRAGDVFNPWIAAYDPDFAAWSPGQIILHELISAMPALGLTRCDLGAGHGHYKKYYANHVIPARAGLAVAAGAARRATAMRTLAWRAARALPGLSDAADRLRRRSDQIAAAELDLTGRIRGAAGVLRRLGRAGGDAEAAA